MAKCPKCGRTNNFENMCGYCDQTYDQMVVEALSKIKEMKEAFNTIFIAGVSGLSRDFEGEESWNDHRTVADISSHFLDQSPVYNTKCPSCSWQALVINDKTYEYECFNCGNKFGELEEDDE